MIKKVTCRKEISKNMTYGDLAALIEQMITQAKTYPGTELSVQYFIEYEDKRRRRYPILIIERMVEVKDVKRAVYSIK